MCITYWSSDVCSSDLDADGPVGANGQTYLDAAQLQVTNCGSLDRANRLLDVVDDSYHLFIEIVDRLRRRCEVRHDRAEHALFDSSLVRSPAPYRVCRGPSPARRNDERD